MMCYAERLFGFGSFGCEQMRRPRGGNRPCPKTAASVGKQIGRWTLNKLKVVEEFYIAILLGLRIAPACNGGFSRKLDNPQENSSTSASGPHQIRVRFWRS